jgi:hypothetical protein
MKKEKKKIKYISHPDYLSLLFTHSHSHSQSATKQKQAN